MTDPILQMKSVSFSYKKHLRSTSQILRGINVDVFPGETLGVIGRNGCGKSTMLRLLAGVLSPQAGVVVKDPSVRCGLLSLGVGFMMDLTGADNVVLSLMLKGMTESRARSLLDEIQAFSELGGSFYERVKTYSAGMRSRLTFSAALFSDCEILLVDEVLAVGDAAFKQKARKAMTDKLRSDDQTVVYVSHGDGAIKKLCDRVLWLDQGKVRLCGSPKDVLSEYKSALI